MGTFWKCPKCGYIKAEYCPYCPKCGAEKETDGVCPRCGYNPPATVCPKCGYEQPW